MCIYIYIYAIMMICNGRDLPKESITKFISIVSVRLACLILSAYFTIYFIFATIHGSHYTISTNFYIYL